MSDINLLLVIWFANIFSHSVGSVGCCFILSMVSFSVQKLLSLIRYQCFYFHYSRGWIKKILLWFMSKCVLPIFSSRSFTVSGLTFRYLIYFEFIFIYGVRECSNFILLHVAIQFSHHHLWHCSFSIGHSWLLCHRLIDHKCVGLFLALHSDPLVYVSVFVPVSYYFDYCSFVVQPEVRKCDSSISILLSQDCLDCSESFVFPYKFLNDLY